MMTKQQIVLAKLVEDSRIIGEARVDLGERHKRESYLKPVAVMWKREGDSEDVARAHEYATADGYTVYVYPTTERDPLGQAKKEISKGVAECEPHKPRRVLDAAQ
jgi:hypothetical protein